jgi:hypothetical protein
MGIRNEWEMRHSEIRLTKLKFFTFDLEHSNFVSAKMADIRSETVENAQFKFDHHFERRISPELAIGAQKTSHESKFNEIRPKMMHSKKQSVNFGTRNSYSPRFQKSTKNKIKLILVFNFNTNVKPSSRDRSLYLC